MVAGRIVFRDGLVATLDEAALRAEARELFGARRAAFDAAAKAVEPLLPHYRAMVAEASRRDIGMSRRVEARRQ